MDCRELPLSTIMARVMPVAQGTHLILGTPEMNRNHAFYHRMMRMSVAEDYAILVDVIQRAKDGLGIF